MLRCTLLTEGPSDACLIPVIEWTFRNLNPGILPVITWADLRSSRPGVDLISKIPVTLKQYPCEILFIHRDADRSTVEERVREIENAVRSTPLTTHRIPLIPVRMTEAWLLIDENAIRIAANNPKGRMVLKLPSLSNLEREANPKQLLRERLTEASGLRSRSRRKFRPEGRARIVSENISDFSPLMQLPAYREFRSRLAGVLNSMGNQ